MRELRENVVSIISRLTANQRSRGGRVALEPLLLNCREEFFSETGLPVYGVLGKLPATTIAGKLILTCSLL
jgi:hypothetical protein